MGTTARFNTLGVALILSLIAAFIVVAPGTVGAQDGSSASDQNIELAYSASADRSAPAALEGATVSGKIYPFVTPLFPEPTFMTVRFDLDGTDFHTEIAPPYDFVSGDTDKATLSWDTASVADGPHSITATGTRVDGTTVTATASFTVDNSDDEPAAADFSIGYSASADRSGAQPLDGATVSGDIYAFVDPLFPTGYQMFHSVSFTLDGSPARTEFLAPYDFAGGGFDAATHALDTTTLTDGSHTIVATARKNVGETVAASVTFTVANETPPPPPPPPPTDELMTYTITVENLTPGQPFTPVGAVVHDPSVGLFTVGEPANLGLQELAENGNPAEAQKLVDAAAEEGLVSGGFQAEAPLVPADDPGGTGFASTETFEVTGLPGHVLTIASMLICTNDGFMGLDSVELPTGDETVILEARAYDAGTEINTEDLADMVPPCQGLMGIDSDDEGTGTTNPELAENGVVMPHAGIIGPSDPETLEAAGTTTFTLTPGCNPTPEAFTCEIVDGSVVIPLMNPGTKSGTFEGTQLFTGEFVLAPDNTFTNSGPVDFEGTVEGCGSGTVTFDTTGSGTFDPATGAATFLVNEQVITGGTLGLAGTLSEIGVAETDDAGVGSLDYTGTYSCAQDGSSDLDPAVFGWTEPVARVTIAKGEAPPPTELPDFFEALAADGRFTTLLAAIEASDVDPPPPGQVFTLLAPTDDAFAALPDGLLDDLLADPGFLTDVLLYHIIEGEIPAEAIATLSETRTLLGAPITIEVVDGVVVLNGESNVVDTDIFVDQGVIHAIDAVLLPPPPPEPLAVLVADFGRGSTEVPDAGDPDALSLAFVDLLAHDDGTTEACFFAVTTVDDPTVAHIHRGVAGEPGDVVVDTGFSADSWMPDEVLSTDLLADGCVDIDPELAAEIAADPGGFYFNVHSTEFPAGATREQLMDAEGLFEFPRAFTAAPLLGDNEVPGPGDSDAFGGFIDFSLPTTDNGDICFRSAVFGTAEITAAHIHEGAAGVAGDIVVDLEVGSRWPVIADPGVDGWIMNGCSPIDADVLAAITAAPGDYYANFHNADFPGGAVRAQLVEGVGEIQVIAELVPAEGSDTEGDGFVGLVMFPAQAVLCWGADANGIGAPTAMSIKLFDTSVVDFDLANRPFAENRLPFIDYTSLGCQPVDADVMNAIAETPGNYTARIDGPDGSLEGVAFDPFSGPDGPPPDPEGVNLQILAINDFHGNIATTSDAFGGVGRADFLASNIAAAEADADNSIMVSAGDLIGASPLVSALFHDEPTIEAMNLIGLEINGVGNHEFDEGPDELLRMANGGSHPVDGDLDGDGFEGADFEFLAANVVDDATGDTIFAPYTVKTYDEIDVAFIGMTLEGTPTIVTPAGVEGLTFNDEVDTVNALIPELQGMGIEAIVVLLHEGGIASEGGGDGDGCGTLSGPLNDIVLGLDDAVDLVIGGHNNQRFACLDVGGKAVTMAYHSGRMFTDIDTILDPETGDMTVVAIDNKENFQEGVTPAADLTELIDRYTDLAAPLANDVIGSITADITEEETDAGESALGDVIADAQLAATSSADTGEAVVAFMNPGGIRADMLVDDIAGDEEPGEVTFGEAFSVQPFGNSLVTMTLTGAQIHELLTQQWVGQEEGNPRILQVSEGFTYTWDPAADDADKVDASTIMIDGVLVDPDGEYRVTVNSFLADGGDNFAVLVDGTDRLGGEVDLDALVTYFEANTPVAPGPQDRISVVEAG